MLINDNVYPNNVVWAYRDVFYDEPDKIIAGHKNMFLILKTENDYFYGCKLEKHNGDGNRNVLKKEYYPIKYDSKVATNIYKISVNDVIGTFSFKVRPATVEHIKRNVYKRIVLGYNEGPKEYQDIFVKDYMATHKPKVDNIISYSSDEKVYKYYYIYDEQESYYSLIPLERNDMFNYNVLDNKEVLMPKSIPYFDYYVDHFVKREDVENTINGSKVKVKSLFK